MVWKGWSGSLTIVGLVLVVFALVWLLAIFPAMNKLQEDHDREVNFEGTYQVMNPETQAMDTIPVYVKRYQLAPDVQDYLQDNVLIINQTVTCTHALAGVVLEDFGLEEVLGVDRSTRAYVSGYGDMDRSGQFCFPSDVKKEESYSTWIPSAGRPLDAIFVSEEEFHGLKVFNFQISEQDLDIGTQEGTGLPQVMDIVTSMKVEPVSGTTVDTASDTTYSVNVQGMKVPYYISSISFTDDTIEELVDTAESARSMILWATVYGFWIAIGLGVVLILVGVVMSRQTKSY
jgi:hypothetical protein